MHYAIVLYLDDEKTAMVKETVKALAPVCGSDYCLGIEPHITVSAIVADAEEPVRKEAERLSKALKKEKSRSGPSAFSIPSFCSWHPWWILPKPAGPPTAIC